MVMWSGSKEYIILRAYYKLPVNLRLMSPSGNSQGLCEIPIGQRQMSTSRAKKEEQS